MLKSLIRTLAFTSNWTALVLRQPSMILSMIAGPFLVLLLFGIGSISQEIPPRTIVVTQDTTVQRDYSVSPEDMAGYLNVIEVTDDLDHAFEELRAQRTRLIVLLPQAPLETIQGGNQALINMFVNEIDPVRFAFVQIDVRAQMALVNNSVRRRIIDAAKGQLDELEPELTRSEQLLRATGVSPDNISQARGAIEAVRAIPTEVLVMPFEADINNIAPVAPTIISYFTPAAIALVVQHLAVTLAGLSLVRARLLGMLELWQVAPVRLGEIVAGDYFSYGILTLLTSATLIVAVMWALSIPVLGPILFFWLSIALLVFASLGLGFVISLLAKNEQTAAQLSMIILLASIFLGGFIQPLETLKPLVRAVSYVLPATYGVQILQTVMVRGQQGDPLHYAALGLIAVIGLVATLWLFRRELRPT